MASNGESAAGPSQVNIVQPIVRPKSSNSAPTQQDAKSSDLDSLVVKGLLTNDEKRGVLKKGIKTIEQLSMIPPSELLGITQNISHNRINSIKIAAFDHLPSPFQPAGFVYLKNKNLRRITTGIKALDELLGGGLEPGSISEFFGESGVGKSLLCHQIAVAAQVPDHPGLPRYKIIYVDTENRFRTENLLKMASRYGVGEAVLNHVAMCQPKSPEDLMRSLHYAETTMFSNNDRIAVLILDSAMSLFRSSYLGNKDLLERQTRIMQMMTTLQRIAVKNNVVVLVTNQVKANMDSTFEGAPQNLPVGGNVFAHAVATRIAIRKSPTGGPLRFVDLLKSPSLPSNTIQIAICADRVGGIEEMDNDASVHDLSIDVGNLIL